MNKNMTTAFAMLIALSLFSSGAAISAPEAQKQPRAPITMDSPRLPFGSGEYLEPRDGLIKKHARLEDDTRSYFVHIPPKSSDGRKPALLLALHGAARSGASMIDKWKDIADRENIVVIAPTAPGYHWSFNAYETRFLFALINEAEKSYQTDPAKVYLFGHSNGAMMAIYMMARHAGNFSAAAIHAGSFPVAKLRSSMGECPNRRFTFITGTEDPIFPLNGVHETADALAECGLDVTQYEIRGHSHWYYDISDTINTLAWNSMKNATLPQAETLP